MGQVERRRFLIAGGALLAAPFAAKAQRAGRLYQIGFVSPTSPGPRNIAFLQGLRESWATLRGITSKSKCASPTGNPNAFQETSRASARRAVYLAG